MLKKNMNTEKKVGNVASEVQGFTQYHHGEDSLCDTIVNMAKSYVGANNINYCMPQGTFGNRSSTKAAAARYIRTYLNPIMKHIFNSEDDDVLITQFDED
jgi:DNA topoisomerase-2